MGSALKVDRYSVECIIYVLTFTAMLGFLIISKRLRSKNTPGDRLFFGMSISVMLFALFSFYRSEVCLAPTELYKFERMASQTLVEMIVMLISYQWMLFTGYIVYGSRDYLRRKYWPFFIPIPVIFVLLIINCFTGFIFEHESMFNYTYLPFYYVITAVKLIYAAVSVFIIVKNNRKADRMHRYHIFSVLMPVLLMPFVYWLEYVRPGPICFMATLIYMFFFLTERWQYEDEEAGFYNKAYLEYMKELVEEGRKDYKAAIILKCKGSDHELGCLIRKELPRDVERVHVDEGCFELYSEHADEDLLEIICEVLAEAAKAHNKNEQSAPIALKTMTVKRKKGEDAVQFLKRIRG